MRRLPTAIVVSIATHAAVFGWLAGSGSVLAVPLLDRPTRTTPPPASEATPDEPIVLTLFDPGEPPPAPSSAPAIASLAHPADRASPHAAAAIGSSTARTSEAPRVTDPSAISTGAAHGTEHAGGEPGRSPLLKMRFPKVPSPWGLSQGFVDDFLARSKPLAPRPDIPGETLAEELAEARRELRSGRGSLQRVLDLIERREHEELAPSGGGTFTAEKRTFTAKVDRDGQVHIEDKPWQLDTQDRIMLRMGFDPYGRNKLALLDRTRDQRAALGERYRTDQLAHAAQLVQRNIDHLWQTARDLAARKRGLFELWDDCAETGSDELVAGGTAARAIVVGAIRARLRGPDAYTADELAQLNALRRSKAVFAPYE
jgi:hypothetical protein